MELLSCKYIPTEIHIVKKESRNIDDYKSKGCKVEKLCDDWYAIKNPPKLELVFRNEEKDIILYMLDDVRRYTGKKKVSQKDINEFVSKIISEEISIEFQSDNYTVNV